MFVILINRAFNIKNANYDLLSLAPTTNGWTVTADEDMVAPVVPSTVIVTHNLWFND